MWPPAVIIDHGDLVVLYHMGLIFLYLNSACAAALPILQSIIDRGELVPDHMVLDALLEVVLNPEVRRLDPQCGSFSGGAGPCMLHAAGGGAQLRGALAG